MREPLARHPVIERHLARLLGAGTALASLIVAIGMLLGWSAALAPVPMATGAGVVSVGIALFLMLPVLRLAVMLWIFLRERDYRFAAITSLVLAVIAASVVLGIVFGAHSG